MNAKTSQIRTHGIGTEHQSYYAYSGIMIMKHGKSLFILLMCFTWEALFANTSTPLLFPLNDVKLLESPFKIAQAINLQYVLALDPDKLAAPYLREAGLPPLKESYSNWESSGLDGHIGGHYLTALSLAFASTDDSRVKQRLEYFLKELKRAQDANGDGYIGGIPDSENLWKEIRKGNIQSELFSLNKRWVPWYNIHKTYAGLRDAWLYTGSDVALQMMGDLGTWTLELTKNLSDDQIQKMLYAEHGGMNEVLADYAEITGNKALLELAIKFSEKRILSPLLAGQDQLNGLHANTQIPKVVGFSRIAQLTQNEDWFNAANFFWQTVVNERSVAIGGNSVSEHFHSKDDFSSMIESIEGPETCNTYNMLKLSMSLYQQDSSTHYVDYYERALYNHILASQHPQTGGMVYFTPMRPQHYRKYSQVDTSMWCCVGSGIENHFKYGEFIYAHENNKLYINLFIPSRLNWKEKGVVVRQKNALPDAESTYIHIESDSEFAMHIRKPKWLKDKPTITLNNKKIDALEKEHYLVIHRKWKKNDTLKITLPMETRLEGLPDGSPWYAIVHGPFVLSAPVHKPKESLDFFADDSRMGHQASGKLCPIVEAPMLLGDKLLKDNENFLNKIQRAPGSNLKFIADEIIINNEKRQLELIPFFRVHDTRYMIYWRLGNEHELKMMKESVATKDKALQQLESLTLDKVTPGQQQPEAEHNYQGHNSESGVHLGRHWRHASGWFSYDLQNKGREAKRLRVTYNGADSGRTFDVIANDIVIATVTSDGAAGPVFVDVDYSLPEIIQTSDTITVRFQAATGSIAGGVFDVRLLK